MTFAMKKTFESYDHLKNVGMSEAQARGIVEVIEDMAEFSFKDLATKSDLLMIETKLETEIVGIKSSIRALQGMFVGGFLVIMAGMVLSFFTH